MNERDNEFVLSVIIRKHEDALQPSSSTDAVKMVREVLEQSGLVQVVGVVGRRHYEPTAKPQ